MSQISQISIKDVIKENRMDAEFHRNVFVNPKLEYDYIGNLLKKNTQYGISIDMNLEGKGYKIYRMNEIENMFCNTEVEKYADIEEKEMKKFKMNDRDVLFNRTNSYEFVGRTGLFRKYSDEDLVFASYLVRVNPDENKILPEYLTAFLNTKYGIFDVKRRAKISINQSNVSAEELKKVRIPIIDMEKQEKIKDLFDNAFSAKQKSKQLYQEAEDLLLTELGLNNHEISHTLTFSTTKKAVDEARRYDADYFQPKYDELIEKIENYKGGFFSFSDKQYVKIIRGSLISDKYYDEKEGTPYIRGADFSSGTLGFDKLVYIDKSFNKQNESVVYSGNIVFSLIGSVGSTALVTEEFNNSFISNNVGYLKLNGINPESVQIMLQSILGQMQFERLKTQTAQPKISSEQMMEIELPLINPKLQKEISDKIKESFKLRNESKELLEQAKKMVEDEIEKE